MFGRFVPKPLTNYSGGHAGISLDGGSSCFVSYRCKWARRVFSRREQKRGKRKQRAAANRKASNAQHQTSEKEGVRNLQQTTDGARNELRKWKNWPSKVWGKGISSEVVRIYVTLVIYFIP